MLVAFIWVLRVQDSAVKNGLYLASGVFVVGRSMVQQQFARPKPVWVHIFRIKESDVVGGTRGTSARQEDLKVITGHSGRKDQTEHNGTRFVRHHVSEEFTLARSALKEDV